MSVGSHSSPRLIPVAGTADGQEGMSAAGILDANLGYGSFRPGTGGAQDGQVSTGGQREPTRSSVHLSYRGAVGEFGRIVLFGKMLIGT